MRILVTGANGITGHAVIKHLVTRGADISGLVSNDASQAAIADLGAAPVVGDLRDGGALRRAMAAADRVYHICPAWDPDELEIGEAVIDAARTSDIELFGYHSVIAPHLEEVPSHWAKMEVQMALMQSGVPFSVVQPAAYMQNIVGSQSNDSVTVPYRIDAPLSWVDAADVGEAVAILMTRPEQGGGTYELCGTETPLSPRGIASLLSQGRRRPVEARTISVEEFGRLRPYSEFTAGQLDRLKAYCRFVDEFGMPAGNSNTLAVILGRTPTPFDTVAERL